MGSAGAKQQSNRSSARACPTPCPARSSSDSSQVRITVARSSASAGLLRQTRAVSRSRAWPYASKLRQRPNSEPR